jgi:hypothetical protein
MIANYTIGQYLVVRFVGSKLRTALAGLQLNLKLILRLIFVVQFVLAAIILTTFFQMVFYSSYDSFLLKAAIWISYVQAISIIGFLAYKFFSWLAFHRSYVILLYSLAIVFLVINAMFTLIHVNDSFVYYGASILPNKSITVLPYLNQENFVTIGFQASSIASYITMWAATIVLLRNHYKRLGSIRYWIAVGAPLVYFFIQFQPVFLQIFDAYRLSEPILFGVTYTLFFSISQPIGGVLFGIAIWSAGKRVENSNIKDFMIIAAYGIILFFTSNQAIILNSAPYPPFGLGAVSLIGLSSFLVLAGFYSSAISIAQDTTLRRSIRRSLKDQSALLSKIGASEIDQQVHKKVLNITKNLSNQMEEKSGIQASFAEEDMKEYIDSVIKNIKQRGTNA